MYLLVTTLLVVLAIIAAAFITSDGTRIYTIVGLLAAVLLTLVLTSPTC